MKIRKQRRDMHDVKTIDELQDKIQDLNQLLIESEQNIKNLAFWRDWWKEIATRERREVIYLQRQLEEEVSANAGGRQER